MTIISARLRSAVLVTGVMASALAFYMVSMRVSAERSAVERLERQIASSMADVRQLQSELGTRERLPQLERWNADVLALSAPKAAQYLDGAVELAAFANDRQPAATDARLQPAIADGATAPRTAQVQTVAYAGADARHGPARQPVVTFAAGHDDAVEQPLLRTINYPAQAATQRRAATVLSDNVLSEIREAAAAEATGLRRASVR